MNIVNKLRQLLASERNCDTPRVDEDAISQQLQVMIKNQWIEWREKGMAPYGSIREAGFRKYSQFEEDGIILYILTMIGVECGSVVEMCCGDGAECMSANLIVNQRFKGFLFDGAPSNIEHASTFFSSKKDCLLVMPELKCSWITRENVNDLLLDAGCPRDVDFFCLDIDGNDYWVWEAIEVISPKVCCFETHDIIPSDLSLTMPYDPMFDCWSKPEPMQDFRSASLAAMMKISAKKGYRLVGAHRHGFNVFFMRNDLGRSVFPEVSIKEVHDNPWTKEGQSRRWPQVSSQGWIHV